MQEQSDLLWVGDLGAVNIVLLQVLHQSAKNGARGYRGLDVDSGTLLILLLVLPPSAQIAETE